MKLFLLLYVLPLVVDLIVNTFINWDDKETLKDFLFPPEGIILSESVWGWYYLPLGNIVVLSIYIEGLIFFLGHYLYEKLGLMKLIQKILSIKIKDKSY